MCICLITACLLNVGVISFEKDENVLALVRTGRNRKRWIIRKLLREDTGNKQTNRIKMQWLIQ